MQTHFRELLNYQIGRIRRRNRKNNKVFRRLRAGNIMKVCRLFTNRLLLFKLLLLIVDSFLECNMFFGFQDIRLILLLWRNFKNTNSFFGIGYRCIWNLWRLFGGGLGRFVLVSFIYFFIKKNWIIFIFY